MKKTIFEMLFGGQKNGLNRRSRISTRTERPAIAHTLSAERLQSILRSAEAGNMRDLFDLYRDIVTSHGHTQSEFSKRKCLLRGICG